MSTKTYPYFGPVGCFFCFFSCTAVFRAAFRLPRTLPSRGIAFDFSRNELSKEIAVKIAVKEGARLSSNTAKRDFIHHPFIPSSRHPVRSSHPLATSPPSSRTPSFEYCDQQSVICNAHARFKAESNAQAFIAMAQHGGTEYIIISIRMHEERPHLLGPGPRLLSPHDG